MQYTERITGVSRISKLKVRKDDGAQKMSGDIMIWRAISCNLKRLDIEVCKYSPLPITLLKLCLETFLCQAGPLWCHMKQDT